MSVVGKPGYKETEAGWIPEDWDVTELEKISAFITKGGTPTTYGFEWTSAENGVPFFRSECVTDAGFNEKGMNFIELAAHQQMIRSEVLPGDVLMTITGNIGRVARAPNQFSKANINQHIARIRINEDVVTDFVYQCLKQESYAKHYGAILTGQAYPQISLKQVRETPIALPPLPEQQKIAAILTAVDDKLDVIARQIEATQTLKRGLMQTLFSRGIGTQDAQGRWQPHTEFQSTELGEIPAGWKVALLQNLSLLKISNGAFNDPKKVGAGYKLINIVDLYQGHKIKTENLKRLELTEKQYDVFKVQRGDLFFTRSSLKKEGIAHCNIFLSDEPDVVYECHMMRVRPNPEKVISKYLQEYSLSPVARLYFMAHGKTTTMTTIDQASLGGLPVPLPPLHEQQKIASIFEGVDEKFEYLSKKQTHYQTLKRGLMQKLLTGEWRVKVETVAA